MGAGVVSSSTMQVVSCGSLPVLLCHHPGEELEVAAHCDEVGLELSAVEPPATSAARAVAGHLVDEPFALAALSIQAPDVRILPVGSSLAKLVLVEV